MKKVTERLTKSRIDIARVVEYQWTEINVNRELGREIKRRLK